MHHLPYGLVAGFVAFIAIFPIFIVMALQLGQI